MAPADNNNGSNTNSLGEFLRQERERRGITIEQVASATKISVRLLHSLEADHYPELPAKPFIRGFVTSYARFVGLDPKEILTRFDSFIDKKAHDRPSREGGHSGYAFEKQGGEQSRTILGIVMGGCVLVGGLLIIVLKPALKHHRQSHVDKLRAGHSQVTQVAASPSPGPSLAAAAPSPSPSPKATAVAAVAPVIKPSPGPSPKPSASSVAGVPAAEPSPKPDPLNSGNGLAPQQIKHKIVVKTTEDVWVRYRCDDRPMMKFMLRKDKMLVLRGERSVRFQFSNPAAITYNYNGRGHKPASGDKNLATLQGTPTLLFSTEAPESIGEPFPGEAPLPATESPPPANP